MAPPREVVDAGYMEPVHHQFKEGFNLGLFFGVVFVAVLFLSVQALNSWWSEGLSIPKKPVITSPWCGPATRESGGAASPSDD